MGDASHGDYVGPPHPRVTEKNGGPTIAVSNRISCLARIDPGSIELLATSLAAVAHPLPVVVTRLGVTEVGLLAPHVLVVDIDGLKVDPLETLRMLRFALPACMIAVYTNVLDERWAYECHIAGANCLLSKTSDTTEVTAGLRGSLRSGCFTDPRFRSA